MKNTKWLSFHLKRILEGMCVLRRAIFIKFCSSIGTVRNGEDILTLLCSSKGFAWVLEIFLTRENVPKMLFILLKESPWMCPLQGLGAAHAGSRSLVLWWRGLPQAGLVLYGPATEAGALGLGEQEQRVQQHPVSAPGGEVQRRVPAAEGEVQSHGEGEAQRVCYTPLPSFQFWKVSHTMVVSVGLAGGDGSWEVCVRRRCHSDVSPGKSNHGCQSFVLSGLIVVETRVTSAKWVSRLDAGL